MDELQEKHEEKTQEELQKEEMEVHWLSNMIGELLWRWRRYLKITQKTGAARAGVSPHYWSKVERGSHNIQVYTLENIIWALGLTVDVFLQGPPTETKSTTAKKYVPQDSTHRRMGKEFWENYFN